VHWHMSHAPFQSFPVPKQCLSQYDMMGDMASMQDLYCAVELHGSLTRGMSTFDWNKTLERPPNVALVKRVNLAEFNAMMDSSTD